MKLMSDYRPLKGFHDLRDFNLSKRVFMKLWKIQDVLHEMNENKIYYQKWHSRQWQMAQELSANINMMLIEQMKVKT